MPPLPADSIHARACKLKCEKILTRPFDMADHPLAIQLHMGNKAVRALYKHPAPHP